MALEWSLEDRVNQWTLMQPSKEEMDVVTLIMDLTMALSLHRTAVLHAVSPGILAGSAKLSQKLSRLSGIATDISPGATRTLSEVQVVNREIMAMEANFVCRLQEKRLEHNQQLIYL